MMGTIRFLVEYLCVTKCDKKFYCLARRRNCWL